MKWLAPIVLVTLAACSPSNPTTSTSDAPPSQLPVYEGDVVSINGQGSEALMRLSMTFTDPDTSGHPQRFLISSRCFDSGYFDTDKKLFLSGHSPIGKGNTQTVADNGRQRCTSDEVEAFQKLLDITYEGFALDIDEPKARLTTPSGQTIDLARNPIAIFAH